MRPRIWVARPETVAGSATATIDVITAMMRWLAAWAKALDKVSNPRRLWTLPAAAHAAPTKQATDTVRCTTNFQLATTANTNIGSAGSTSMTIEVMTVSGPAAFWPSTKQPVFTDNPCPEAIASDHSFLHGSVNSWP